MSELIVLLWTFCLGHSLLNAGLDEDLKELDVYNFIFTSFITLIFIIGNLTWKLYSQ